MGPGRGRNQLENDVNRRCVCMYIYIRIRIPYTYIVFYEVQIFIENILGEQDLWSLNWNNQNKNRRNSKEVKMKKVSIWPYGSISFLLILFELHTLRCHRMKPGMPQSTERKSPDLRLQVNSSQSSHHGALQNFASLDRMLHWELIESNTVCTNPATQFDMYFNSENLWGILHFRRATTQMRTTQITKIFYHLVFIAIKSH